MTPRSPFDPPPWAKSLPWRQRALDFVLKPVAWIVGVLFILAVFYRGFG